MSWALRIGLLVLRSRGGRKLLLATVLGLVAGVLFATMFVSSAIGAIFSVCEQSAETVSAGDDTPQSVPSYTSSEPSGQALAGIPEHYYEEYRAAGEEYNVDWAILAAVGYTESTHGENGKEVTCINSSAGATGPMQFMPATWSTEGVDGNNDGKKDSCDYEDAIPAAAGYLRDGGAPLDWRAALFQYNNSQAYVDDVLAKAEEYRASAEGDDRPDLASGEDSGESPEDASGAGPAPIPALISPAYAQEAPRGSGEPPQGWDTVDESRMIHYELDSAYADHFEQAVATWNELGGVDIEPSPSSSETDLVVSDGPVGGEMAVTRSDGNLIYDPSGMDGATENAREAVSIHELGHALGFPHNSEESVMRTPIITNTDTNLTDPTAYDEELYEETWGVSGEDSSEGSGGEDSNDGSGTGPSGTGSASGAGLGSGLNIEDPSEDSSTDTSEAMPTYCRLFQVAGFIDDVGERISDIGGGSEPVIGSGAGQDVVEEAAQYEGTDYVLGGLEECVPGKAMDCTCLTMTVFEEFGYDGADTLPDSPQDLLSYGESVPVEEAQAGDVIVYADPGDGTGGHAAIATGDGGVFHCASPALGCIFTLDYESAGVTPPIAARRLVDEGSGGGDSE